MGKLSLPMFLNQGWIRKLMIYYNFGSRFSYKKNLQIYFGIVIVVSLISVFLTDFVLKQIRTVLREQ